MTACAVPIGEARGSPLTAEVKRRAFTDFARTGSLRRVAPFTRTLPEQVGGKYRIDRLLGEGGAGCVYHAIQADLNREVAIKVVRPGRETAHSVERMRREARAVAKLHGPHVVRLLDYGDDPSFGCYLVMEYVEGATLRDELESGPIAPPRAVSLAIQACEALREAHSHGIVHRDIKPANLMLGRAADGREILKVADFGIAKAESHSVALHSVTLTESATILGSPKYMSPEQIREARSVDARSDLWSLGVVLYEMVSGRLPFEAFTASGLLARISADAPAPLHDRMNGVSPELENVVMACLEKDPSRRIASAEVLAERLRSLSAHSLRLSDLPKPKSPGSTGEQLSFGLSPEPAGPPLHRWAPPRSWLIGALALVASLVPFAAGHGSSRPAATPEAPRSEVAASALVPIPTTVSSSPSVTPPSLAPSPSAEPRVIASSRPVVVKNPTDSRSHAKVVPAEPPPPLAGKEVRSDAFVDFGPRK